MQNATKLNPFPDLLAALKEARSALYDTQQACLFDDDNGSIGVSEEVVISSCHFDKICKALKQADAALSKATSPAA